MFKSRFIKTPKQSQIMSFSCNINFEINLSFLIKPFCYMTKKSRQKLKNLEKENSF